MWFLRSMCSPSFTGYFVGRFRGRRFCKPFMNVRFEFPISLYTFGYRRTRVRMHVVHNSKTAVDIERRPGAAGVWSMQTTFSGRVKIAMLIKRCERFCSGNQIAEALMQESIKGVEKATLCRAKPMCRGLFGPFGRHSLSELRLRRLSNVVKCSAKAARLQKR